jgi:hypothetical protein
MTKRIKPPVNETAFRRARTEYLETYRKDLTDEHGHPKQIQPGSRTHKKLREGWLKLYEKHGGLLEEANFQDALVPQVKEPCPLLNQIVSVEILDGGDNTFLAGTGTQHVNLPQDQKFVDGTHVTNLDRLGRKISVKVAFKLKKKEKFMVSLLSHQDNAAYTVKERGRKASFSYQRPAARHPTGSFVDEHGDGTVFTGTTKSDGTAVLKNAFEVTPAGGDQYKVVAWDINGNVVYSPGTIQTTRTIYYATFLADDPANVRIDQNAFRTQIEQAYSNFHVNLVFIGEEQVNGLVYHDIIVKSSAYGAVNNLSKSRNSQLNKIYDVFKPYLIRFLFVDHCARIAKKEIEPVLFDNVAPNTPINVPIFVNPLTTRQRDPTFDWRRCLWVGLRQATDPAGRTSTGHEWFESCLLEIRSTATGNVEEEIRLTANELTLVARDNSPNAKVQVSINIGNLITTPKHITVKLTACVVIHAVMGETLTDEGAGITVQPSRHMFANVPDAKQISSCIHELGHALGMVATEAKQGVGHQHQYDLNGSHCWTGVHGGPMPPPSVDDYHKLPYKETGTCVMYGLIPPHPNMAFCADCAKIIRKLDLSGGLTG